MRGHVRAVMGAAVLCTMAGSAGAHEIRQNITVEVDRGWFTVTSRLEIEPEEQNTLVLPVLLEGMAATDLRLGPGGITRSRVVDALGATVSLAEAPTAVLAWDSAMQARLQLTGLDSERTVHVETRTEGPMDYWDGEYQVPLFALGYEGLIPRVTFEVAHRGDLLHWNGAPMATGEAYEWNTEGMVADLGDELRLIPASAPAFEGHLVSIDLGERTLVGLTLRAGPQPATIPFGARVVVLLDTSRSMAPAVVHGSIAAIRAYLYPMVDRDTKVQVVAFDREARPLLGGFVPAQDAIDALKGMRPRQHNGSDLEGAVAMAVELLAAGPRGKPRRLVILSDLERAPHASAEALAGAIERSGALVHVGQVVGEEPGLEVLEEPSLSAAVEATGGLVWRASVSGHMGHGEKMRDVFAQWVSPQVVRDLELVGVTDMPHPPESLQHGREDSSWWLSTQAPRRVRVSGRLWAKPVKIELRPQAALRRRLAMTVMADEIQRGENLGGGDHGLTAPEGEILARLGGAVSPWTSRRAGPGAGHAELEPEARVSLSTRILCRLSLDTTPRAAGLVRLAFDEDAFLRDAVEEVARGCHVGGAGLEIDVDTTVGEIIGVGTPRFGRDVEPATSQCVVDGLWEIEFPPGKGPSRRHELVWSEVPLATRL